MTWGNLTAKSLSLIFLLPLILTNFSAEDVVVWYIFANIYTLQMLIDLGFTPTFTRITAYGLGGVSIEELSLLGKLSKRGGDHKPNWETIGEIFKGMKYIYARISALSFLVASVVGTILVYKPLNNSTNPEHAWMCWIIVVVSNSVVLYGNYLNAYLQGLDKVALFQRWRMVTSLMQILSSSLVLFFGGELLLLILTYQSWPIINFFINVYLKRHIYEGKANFKIQSVEIREQVWKAVWPSAWRSGLGVVFSQGIIQVSGLLYANLGSPGSAASYLLGLQIIRAINSYSQAPFYSKIPIFSRLYAKNEISKMLDFAKKSMNLAYAVYVSGFLAIGFFSTPLLELIGSDVTFPSQLIWAALGVAFFVERYGAMHLQIYSVTNDIIWHVANGISGILMIGTAILLYPHLEVLSFPISFLIGYTIFYAPYTTYHSYSKFNISFLSFEMRSMIPSLVIMLTGIFFLLIK